MAAKLNPSWGAQLLKTCRRKGDLPFSKPAKSGKIWYIIGEDRMDIVILDSAYKHGITEANISYCLSHFNNDIMLNYPPMKRLFVGFDNVGRALEIIAIEDDEQDCLVVIHAMKLTKQYYFLLEGV